MSEYLEVPVSAAKELAENFSKSVVIVLAWDAIHGMLHTTTYGVTADDKRYAALGGGLASEALGADLAKATQYSDYRDKQITALLNACKVVKAFLDSLEENTEAGDPLMEIRREVHAPLRAALEPAIALAEGRA